MAGMIPRDFIHGLLARVDIVEVIDHWVPLKKTGRNYQACCPFHTEKTPSFSVSPAKQFYHCFGCGVSGNAVSFLMDYQRLDFVEAIEALAQQYGLTVPREALSSEAQAAAKSTNDLYDLLENAKNFYVRQLKFNAPAKEYLLSRGLNDDIIQRYEIGCAPAAWDELSKTLGQTELLLQSGLAAARKNGNGHYDYFRERIMFPIRNHRGKVVGFGGRVLDQSLPKYLNSPDTPLFHKNEILYGFYEACQAERQINQFLVVEGYMDVVALAQAGITYAVATMGTATQVKHIQQMLRQTRKIIFCFDGDKAGIAAAKRAFETVLSLVTDSYAFHFLFLPTDEDPDSLVRREGVAAFTQRLHQSLSLSEFLFQQQNIALKTLEDRTYFVETVVKTLDRIQQAPNLKALLIDELARLSSLDKQMIINRLDKKPAPLPPPALMIKNPQGRVTPMQMAIALLLQYPYLIQHITEEINFTEFCLPGSEILQALRVQLIYQPELTTGQLIEAWRDKTEAKFIHRLASRPLTLPENGIVAEWQGTLQHVQKQSDELARQLLYEKKQQGIVLTATEQAQFEYLFKKL